MPVRYNDATAVTRAPLVLVAGCLRLLASCDRVYSLDRPAGPDAAAAADASPDIAATPDAPNCITDGFDGTLLASTWSVLAGAIPVTYEVSASRLSITDAPFSNTPSMAGVSWIYDLGTDKANQIAWAQPIGGADFTLTADLGWSSTLGELTLGGVGVSDAQGAIAALAVAQDGSQGVVAAPVAWLHVTSGADLRSSGAQQEPGSAHITIQRTGGMASISFDGAEVLSGPLPDLISNVVVVYVRYRNATGPNTFGSIEVQQIQICRP